MSKERGQASLEYTLLWVIVLVIGVGLIYNAYIFLVQPTAEKAIESPIEKHGKLVIFLTDTRVENLAALNVTVSNVEVHRNGKWISFQPEQRTFELLSLADAGQIIGQRDLNAGHYTQIRMQVESASISFVDGASASVRVPGKEIKIVREFEVEENSTTILFIDFSAESVIESGKEYLLQPVVKLESEGEFGERLCQKSICKDGNPCTEDNCSMGICSFNPARDGKKCGKNHVCRQGECVQETQETQEACENLAFFQSFPNKGSMPLPFITSFIALADFDNDNDLDVFANSWMSQNVTYAYAYDSCSFSWYYANSFAAVFLNDGNGNFSWTGQEISASHFIVAGIGDIDGDEDNDIVAGNAWGDYMIVYKNNGKGNFTDSQHLGHHYDGIVRLGDLDGDRDLDILVGNYQLDTPSKVFLNDGKGSFSQKIDSGLRAGQTFDIQLLDIDNDNDLDAVEMAFYYKFTHKWVFAEAIYRVYKNNGSAKFSVAKEFRKNNNFYDSYIAVGDIEKDGDMDFAISSHNVEPQSGYYFYGTMDNIFRNDGRGVFKKEETLGLPPDTVAYYYYVDGYLSGLMKDIDNDGDLDFPTIGHFMLNDGTGKFTRYCWNQKYVYKMAIGDIDNDADQDVISTNYSGFSIFKNTLINK